MFRNTLLLTLCAVGLLSAEVRSEDLRDKLIRENVDFELSYGDSRVLQVQTGRYTLYFQREPGCPIRLDSAIAWIDAGVKIGWLDGHGDDVLFTLP